MKAIFINAKEQTVSYVENKGNLEDLYLTLGVNMVEIGRYYPNGDTLWIDEEGLLNGTDFGFKLDDIDYVGNGLIYGTNRMNPELNDSAVTDIKKLNLEFFKLEFA